MTITDRIAQLVDTANRRKIAVDVEIFDPVGFLLAIGERLGMTVEEAFGPVDE